MASKNFRDDPVMKFISIPSIPQKKVSDLQPSPPAESPTETVPAAAAMESPSIEPRQKKKAACPPAPANKNNPKGRRVQLLFRDQLYNDVKRAADAANLSVNEWIHRTLENVLYER